MKIFRKDFVTAPIIAGKGLLFRGFQTQLITRTTHPVVHRGRGKPDSALPGAGAQGGGHHGYHADQVPAGAGERRTCLPHGLSDHPACRGVCSDRAGQDPDPGAPIHLQLGRRTDEEENGIKNSRAVFRFFLSSRCNDAVI